MALHDPLAVAVAIDPSLVKWEAVRLANRPDGETQRARRAECGSPRASIATVSFACSWIVCVPHARARRVLVVGSANVDFTSPRRACPPSANGDRRHVARQPRRQGANPGRGWRAVSAPKCGSSRASATTAPGETFAPRWPRGIGVEGVGVTREAATGTAAHRGRPRGTQPDRRWRPGELASFARARPLARRRLRVGAVVVCQLETALETLAWTLEEARRRGAATILNPAPVRDGLPDIWRWWTI
jgi:sugar/nucleoside kinase (ribokinase family)